MWNRRSAAHHVVSAFICLISTLFAVGAHAQTAADASDTKRVQVLQIREAGVTNVSSAKKSKTAAMHAKKQAVQRRTNRPTEAAANEDAHAAGAQIPDPNGPVQSTMAVVAPATPAQNDGLALSTEPTGTLAVGDHAVALATSLGDDTAGGFSTANYVGRREDQSASALTLENRPRAGADAEHSPGAQMVGPQVPARGSSPLSQWLVTLSGAMLAAVFGWYLFPRPLPRPNWSRRAPT